MFPAEYMSRAPEDLAVANYQEKVRNPYDFRFSLLASTRDGRKDRAFYLGELCPMNVSKTKLQVLLSIFNHAQKQKKHSRNKLK